MNTSFSLNESDLALVKKYLTTEINLEVHAPTACEQDLESLPEGLRQMPHAALADIDLLLTDDGEGKWKFFANPDVPSFSSAAYEWFAIIRGELPFPTREIDEDGYGLIEGFFFREAQHTQLGIVVRIVLGEPELRAKLRECRETFERRKGWGKIYSIVPSGHRFNDTTGKPLTRASITPWVPSNDPRLISAETQQSRIDNYLRKWAIGLRSLVICGPYNTSKTTFASAYITDVITERVATTDLYDDGYFGYFHPCVWAINLNEWLDQYLNWRTRNYDDTSVSPPSITAEVMRDNVEKMGLPPVLWIEELDKVSFTEANKKWLHTLVNAVYQMDGCIVATTNSDKAALHRELGEGIVGRLDGSRDGTDRFVFINFAKPKKK